MALLMSQDILNKVFTGSQLRALPSVQDALNAVYDAGQSALRINFGGVVPTGVVSRTPVAVPVTNASAGAQGDWSYDGQYFYWCVSANTWIRVAPERVW